MYHVCARRVDLDQEGLVWVFLCAPSRAVECVGHGDFRLLEDHLTAVGWIRCVFPAARA